MRDPVGSDRYEIIICALDISLSLAVIAFFSPVLILIGLKRSTARNDTRITRVGKPLRNLRIDEFPQILNILSGALQNRVDLWSR